MTVMPLPAATGRGAWTKRGNKLGKTMYLRGASHGVSSCDTQDKWAVNRAVLAIQKLLGYNGYPVQYDSAPGVFGPLTDASTRAFQTKYAAPADGIVGPTTSKALLRKLVKEHETQNGIPGRILWGLIGNETSWDLGAVGYTTPQDVGICQINLYYNQSISPDSATDPFFAIPLTASRLRTRYNQYLTYSGDVQRAWDAAILGHNSPARALTYAKTGVYPTEQAAAYVASVRKMSLVP